MDMYRKSFAVFFASAFVVTGIAALFFFNFDRRAFTAETYQQAFAQEDFYNKIPGLIAQSILSGTETTQQPLGMQGLSQETWESFIGTLLPPDVVKPIGDDLLNSTFEYLNLESSSIQVNLIPFKTRMMGETGAQAALSLINALPACTLDQSVLIMFGMVSGGQIELCRPPDDILPMLMPLVQGQMQAAAAIIPDELTVVTAPLQDDPRERLQTARFLMRFSLILPLMFLITLTAFAVRSLKDWLLWWGIPFFVTGAISFILSLLGAPVFGSMLERILTSNMAGILPVFLADFAGDLASAMARALLNPILWQGAVLAIIGAGMAGVGYFIKPK